jgi:hypothetical protein
MWSSSSCNSKPRTLNPENPKILNPEIGKFDTKLRKNPQNPKTVNALNPKP